MTTDLVIAALNMALLIRKPESVIHHSDQGSQRACGVWQTLQRNGCQAQHGNSRRRL